MSARKIIRAGVSRITGSVLTGTAANNSLSGSGSVPGIDTIDGGAGNDTIRGYGGGDVLTGGTGNDTFSFERTWSANGIDVINDFEFGFDILNLGLVGFERSGLPIADSIRLQSDGNGNALFLISTNRDNVFAVWAVLNNAPVGSVATVSVSASTYYIPVI